MLMYGHRVLVEQTRNGFILVRVFTNGHINKFDSAIALTASEYATLAKRMDDEGMVVQGKGRRVSQKFARKHVQF